MGDKKNLNLNKLIDNLIDGTKNIADTIVEKSGDFVKESGLKDMKDYYTLYTWPPLNLYTTLDNSLIFEFGLPGFVKDDVKIDFEGDYMLFSAQLSNIYSTGDSVRFFKKKLKLSDIKVQKYYLPIDEYERKNYTIHMKNGLLRVVFQRIEQ